MRIETTDGSPIPSEWLQISAVLPNGNIVIPTVTITGTSASFKFGGELPDGSRVENAAKLLYTVSSRSAN